MKKLIFAVVIGLLALTPLSAEAGNRDGVYIHGNNNVVINKHNKYYYKPRHGYYKPYRGYYRPYRPYAPYYRPYRPYAPYYRPYRPYYPRCVVRVGPIYDPYLGITVWRKQEVCR